MNATQARRKTSTGLRRAERERAAAYRREEARVRKATQAELKKVPSHLKGIQARIREGAADGRRSVVWWVNYHLPYEVQERLKTKLEAKGYTVTTRTTQEEVNMGDTEAPCTVTERSTEVQVSW